MKWEKKIKRCKNKECKDKFEQQTPFDFFCCDDCKDGWYKESFRKQREKMMNKKQKPIKRTRIKQIGKVGKRNIQANAILKIMFRRKDITSCEIMFEGCTGQLFLTNAHKHKREWYRPKAKQGKLYAFREVLRACQHCHQIIEDDKELTQNIFSQLRPK